MQNSIKHMAAAVIVFTAYISCTVILVLIGENDAASLFTNILTLFMAAIFAVICIIVAVRHKKTRRYFVSLSLVMICNFFAEIYLGLFLLLYGSATWTPPIIEISYLGAEGFLAALCARIWYEEIPKTAVNRRKITAVAIAAVLFVLAVGAVSFLGGVPVLTITTLYLVIDGAVLCYSLRFFTVPSAAKPFLPLMVIITLYVVYLMFTTFILPLVSSLLTDLSFFLLSVPLTLLVMLFPSFLMFAGERMPEKPELNTAAESPAAEKEAVLSDAGGMK